MRAVFTFLRLCSNRERISTSQRKAQYEEGQTKRYYGSVVCQDCIAEIYAPVLPKLFR